MKDEKARMHNVHPGSHSLNSSGGQELLPGWLEFLPGWLEDSCSLHNSGPMSGDSRSFLGRPGRTWGPGTPPHSTKKLGMARKKNNQ